MSRVVKKGKNIYEVLDNLNIEYEEIKHNAVYTVEEANKIESMIEGIGCKNLFLTDKNKYFLYVLKDDKRADLKELAKYLNVLRLRNSIFKEYKSTYANNAT